MIASNPFSLLLKSLKFPAGSNASSLSGLSESRITTDLCGISDLCCNPSSSTTTSTSGCFSAIAFTPCLLFSQTAIGFRGLRLFKRAGSSPTFLQSPSASTQTKPLVLLINPLLKRATFEGDPSFLLKTFRKYEA